MGAGCVSSARPDQRRGSRAIAIPTPTGPVGPKGQRRNYSAITTRNYLRVVADFAKYFGKSPDKLGPNELRTYQAHLLQDRQLTPGTVVNRVAALRFFFVKPLETVSLLH